MKHKLFLLIPILILTTSCSFVPLRQKAFEKNEIPESFRNEDSEKISRDDVVLTEWWKEYNDVKLNETIELMLENNLDVKLALSRLGLLDAQKKAARGARLPSAAATGSYKEIKKELPGPLGQTRDTTSVSYSAGLALKYELDIWGKLRASHKSAVEAYKASKADLQTVYHGLILQTISLHFGIKYQIEEVKINERKLNSLRHTFNVTEKKYKLGTMSKTVLETVRQNLNNLTLLHQSSLAQLDDLRNQMAVLLGKLPQNYEYVSEDGFKSEYTYLNIPKAIPSELLKTRGDIVSAEHSMESARQAAGAAFADFFPSISLSAALNFASLDFDDLFEDTSKSEILGADVTQAVFTGGAKTYNYKAKKRQYEQAVLNYRKTVLNAFRDVESALKTYETAKLSYILALENKKSAESIFDTSTTKYKRGVISYSSWQEAETGMLNSVSSLNNAYKNLVSAESALHRALGGNWIISN